MAGTAAGGARALWAAIGVSLLLHAALLSLHFRFPDASRALRDRALDIILVNARSERKPTEAQALAQANLDGGGNTEENRRAATPLPPSPREQTGNDLEQTQKRVQALETQQQRLLTQTRKNSRTSPPPDEARPPSPPDSESRAPPDPPALNGRDLANSALAMTRFEAEINSNIDEYNKRPRLRTFGARAEEYAGAAYFDAWARKVEKIGTLNFPAQARGKIYGKVTVYVELWRNGDLRKVEISRTSGARVLDDASLRIIRMGAPYGEIPGAMIGGDDVIGFARTLLFTNENQLRAN
ncbi:MAG: energy transducer TonB [Candidatus Accumulibacter sp.]|nr:energy transducer TonB [Accumulibacter sp.]